MPGRLSFPPLPPRLVCIKEALEVVLAPLRLGGVQFATARYFGRLDAAVVHLTDAVRALNDTVADFRRETDARLDNHEGRIAHIEGRLGRRASDTGVH